MRPRLELSWWLAAELFRRHPGYRLFEYHPGGGPHDRLPLRRSGSTTIDINRAGRVHVHSSATFEPMEFSEILSGRPDDVLARIQTAARLSPPDQTLWVPKTHPSS